MAFLIFSENSRRVFAGTYQGHFQMRCAYAKDIKSGSQIYFTYVGIHLLMRS